MDKPVRDKLLAKVGRRVREIEVPDVGTVRIKNLTAREQIAVADSIPDDSTNLDAGVTYIIHCVVDEQHQPVFTEADREALLDLDSGVMATIFAEIRQLCGLDVTVKSAAKN